MRELCSLLCYLALSAAQVTLLLDMGSDEGSDELYVGGGSLASTLGLIAPGLAMTLLGNGLWRLGINTTAFAVGSAAPSSFSAAGMPAGLVGVEPGCRALAPVPFRHPIRPILLAGSCSEFSVIGHRWFTLPCLQEQKHPHERRPTSGRAATCYRGGSATRRALRRHAALAG